MSDDGTSCDWGLSDEDRSLLDSIANALWGLVPIVRSPEALIGLGEALDAIQCILKAESVNVNVGISVGFRQGDRDFHEGLFVCGRFSFDEVVLDGLSTSYSSEAGADHFTREYARLGISRHFDAAGVWDWLEKLKEVKSFDDVAVSVSRDHI